jgi:hypothetical protein
VCELIRRQGALASAVHCAFDLLELDVRDLRREPIEERKALLTKLLRGSNLSIVLNEHFEETARLYFARRANSAARGFSANGLAQLTARVDPRIGSRSKTRKLLPCAAKQRRIGVAETRSANGYAAVGLAVRSGSKLCNSCSFA